MAAKSRYAAHVLAPANEAGASVVCVPCGLFVADTAAHDKFHALLASLAPARPKGETRGKS